MSKKDERLGEVKYNNFGEKMIIVEYNDVHNIIVEFQDEFKYKVHTKYVNFKNGVVKNPYYKGVYNIGYIGVGKYSRKNTPKIYSDWHKMLQRCYDPFWINNHLSYIDCVVCDEWLCLQNFGKWHEENYYKIPNEIIDLDKDILIKGNKVYSPKTCVFVPQRINKLILTNKRHRGAYLIGCDEKQDKIRVRCLTTEGSKHLGYFPLNKPFQAFTCYKNFKENYIKQVADEYKDYIPEILYKIMYEWRVEIND